MSSASESYSPGASREAWPTCARSSPGEISPVLSIVDVNEDNHLWEYDQLNIICPIISEEKHIISKPEFDSCWVFHPRPKIVAVCDRPRSFKYFTITFRSFSPSPGGLEFKPGHTYYFVSTSTINDVHRRAGGYCSSHNMKMVFKIANNTEKLLMSSSAVSLPSIVSIIFTMFVLFLNLF